MNPPNRPESGPDEQGALIALASLEGIGPATLLDIHRSVGAVTALEALRARRFGAIRVLAERLPGGERRGHLVRAARALDPAELLAANTRDGHRILIADRAGFPQALERDPAPPAILFVDGDPRILDQPAVAIIGTRNTTRIGREIAVQIGADLARRGVHVTSGLALGIDGAAHDGVLTALEREPRGSPTGRPIGVIASGLDIAYPRRHGPLQRKVAAAGVIVTELPRGHRPSRWRFPARNRLIAALSAGIVVVESRITGGSMSTVDAAIERGIEVMAVPGHPLAPASAGTNQLIADGAALTRGVDDIADALGWELTEPSDETADDAPGEPGSPVPERAGPGGLGGDILTALHDGPASLAELITRIDAPMADIASNLVRLEADRFIVSDGVWFELASRGAGVIGS